MMTSLDAPHPSALPSHAARPAARPREGIREEGPSMHTVLIAEDEPSLRLLVRASLQPSECDVVEAADGDAAWELLLQHRPAVAILDVWMPGRNGLDLTRAIRGSPALAGTHVILLTGSAQTGDVAAGLAAGANQYLAKPFSPSELRGLVDRALRGA